MTSNKTLLSENNILKIFVIIQLILLGIQFTPDLSTNGDDARYYLLGKALHDGNGYRQIQHPTHPVEKTYPILFPLLLAFLQLFSSSIMFAKIIQAIMGAGITILAFHLFKKYSQTILIPAIILCAISATLIQFSSTLMSETPYIFFSLLALYLYELSINSPKNKWLFWITIVVSVFPMHCRSVGLAFSASWLLTNIITKRYKYAITHAVILFVTVVIFRMLTSWENGYLIQIIQRNTYNPEAGFVTLPEMITRIFQNILAYSTTILERALFPLQNISSNIVKTVITLIFLTMIIIGLIRSLFGQMKFLSLYVIIYFGILLMWQTQWSSERFVCGVIPFLYFFLFYGLEAIILFLTINNKQNFINRIINSFKFSYAIPLYGKITIWVIVLMLGIFNLSFQTQYLKKIQELGPDWKNFYSCADWIRLNTSPDAIVMNRKVELFYLRSKRKGVMYSYTHDPSKILKEIDDNKVNYVILDNFAWTQTTQKYLYPVIRNFPQRFKLVYVVNNPPTAVYEVIK